MADVRSCPPPDRLVELALGQLSGRDRSEVLAHLERCPACRHQVEGWADLADRALLATAEAEPPAGFENEVLARIDRSRAGPAARRRAWRWVPAAAAALLLVAAAVAVVVGGGRSAALAEAPMVTAAGGDVGSAWRYDGEPRWVFVSVPGWRAWEEPGGPSHRYRLRATLDDGSTADLGPVDLAGGGGSWGTTVDEGAGRIRTVAIVDEAGTVWCQGRF